MKQGILRHVTDRRGATLPLVALSMVTLLSMAALAVDLGMLYNARAEAQRAADAGALAGASVYMQATTPPEGHEAAAEALALQFATENHLLGRSVETGEVAVFISGADSMVTVNVSRAGVPTLFAGLFGQNFANVGASASARVTTSGTAGCIKPFAIPHDTYTDDDVGTRVLLWESKGNKDTDIGETNFLLVGTPESPNGVGHDIYHMLLDTSCEFAKVEVGDDIPAQPSNNARGNVRKGLSDIVAEYGELTWSPDGPYDGFNRADWVSDPRVSLIPMYDMSTYTPPGTDDIAVTGFIRVMIESVLETCQNGSNNHPPCNDPDVNGQQKQLYAVVLPSVGVPDDCAGTGCSNLNLTLRLIR